MEKYIGLMSGTSLDGVDAVIVETNGTKINLLGHADYPMDPQLKADLLAVCTGQQTNLKVIGEIDHRLGHLFADATLHLLNTLNIAPSDITAIGSHGQTVFHSPDAEYPFTMQLGDSNIIAAKTGIDTIADFRRKDMALGGQGAPLVPAFHHTLFGKPDSTNIILNIGGISNISILQKDSPVIGYDTGPGNMLMDSWITEHKGESYDKGGAWARSGQIIDELLNQLKTHDYFARPYPKSTGRELFNLDWFAQYIENKPYQPQDVQATLLEFTVVTIVDQVIRFQVGNDTKLLVCGGGAHNQFLMERLQYHLPNWAVSTTNDYNVDSDNMEAMAFAWLAHQRIHGLPSNEPDVTGASRYASLGVIYPAN
ncbi:anhydro-N-acetylmuramic acid kinase [Aliivibrio fischeri]|uniref:anhydro-N-acetylmuramic acid kinase n=1 Tax=Aliivibrio fischeri TaxID=668 RepID=UPI0012D9B17D|nr:anhydro-N-acetylmuramic acid kinase [Aliivibrio fischeri]MUK62822.1 anhydro-N-acetylmuramic acid kinase [Aliivibrio fischeri]MUL22278.1 anhydro-N-acetylmuramic acid kinase [Aliivibrio fischeri]MUL26069.1 anhydro-N-acetylmuramic acid kinase [Aliivibrio fischeri]